jgi:hypothetical protein
MVTGERNRKRNKEDNNRKEVLLISDRYLTQDLDQRDYTI